MTLLFYKYTGPEIVFNKTSALALLTPLTISSSEVAGDQDLENVVLHVTSTEHSLSGYNYVYIQDWSRYYYILATRWLANGIYSITLQEDYLQTWAVVVPSTYQGIARYSGLGDSNLVDPRCNFKPETTIAAYDLFFANTNAVPLQDWYCVKFMSTNPYEIAPSPSVPKHYLINIAIMNTDSYKKFIESYIALGEPERVAVARMILSVNRVKYIAPDPTALADYKVASVQFSTPFDYNSVNIVVATGSTSEYETYIISDPDAVQYIFNRRVTVVNPNTTTAHTFNANNRFYELNAQYVLKLAELQPINFVPAVFGKKSSFTIYFDIGYEPYSESYVIKFYPDSTTKGNQSPIVQRCQTSIPFMADTSLDFYEQKSLTNTLGMVGGISGGVGSAIFSLATLNLGGAVQAVNNIIAAPTNFDMTQKQMAVQEYTGMGVTSALGGSPDWIYGAINAEGKGQLFTLTQEPVATFWSVRGKPDGALRSFLALAGTGYAEVDLIDPPALSGATYNEMRNLKAALAQGAIF